MSKNLMPEVAKLLGVEIGEKFRLRFSENEHCNPEVYYFTENSFDKVPDYENTDERGEAIIDNDDLWAIMLLLGGEAEIVKLPWEPKEGERYFYPSISAKRVDCTNWICCSFDYAMKALGMVYKTLEEAQECFAEDYERLTGEVGGISND